MSVLYDERAELHGPYFNEAGRIVPSVTSVIGDNLGWDADKLHGWIARVTREGYDHEALRDIAAEVGTCAHQMVERHLNPELKPLDPNVWSPRVWEHAQQGLHSFVEWQEEHEVYDILFSELKLVHEPLQYGGTLDFGAVLHNRPALIDFKTSDAVRTAHVVQVSAYRELWRENLDGDPRIIVLRLPVYGEEPHMEDVTSSMDLAFRTFKQCLELNALKREWEHGADDRLAELLQ